MDAVFLYNLLIDQAFSFFCSPEKPEFLLFNLKTHDTYSKLPYVCASPEMLLFAAVPIISPAGPIGTVAIFDDVDRDSMDTAALLFMRDLASTTMQHLEICRAHRINLEKNSGGK